MPLASAVIKNSTEEEISAPSAQNVDNGIWFARLKDNKTPEFVVDESTFGMAGLWAANGDTYTISSEGAFEFKTLEEPAAPTETGTFLMCSNPNTFTITLKQSAYILTADGTSFEQEANPEIKPFQSFVLTDAKTLSTLRSLRIGDGVGRWLLRDYRSWRYRDPHAGAYGRGDHRNEWQGRLSWRGYGRPADHGFFGHLCRERSISKG